MIYHYYCSVTRFRNPRAFTVIHPVTLPHSWSGAGLPPAKSGPGVSDLCEPRNPAWSIHPLSYLLRAAFTSIQPARGEVACDLK